MGTFNNPTGSLIDPATRNDIIALLSRRGIPLIEDDIYGELYFGEHRPPTFHSSDTDGTVLCCSAFSRSIAPGYRMGWIIADQARLPELLNLMLISSSSSTALPQQVIADFLQPGLFDRYLNHLRRLAREQVRRNHQALLKHGPEGARISDPAIARLGQPMDQMQT